MRGLLDTSVFIAREEGRPLGDFPEEAAVSVMTLAELHLGVLLARTPRVRAMRLRTLARVERTFDPLPVDGAVARLFAEVVAEARRTRRRPKFVDALIAATAAVHGIPVYSQDADFKAIPRVRVVLV